MVKGLRVFGSLVLVFLVASSVFPQEKPVYGFPEAFPEVHAFFDWQFINFQEEGYVEGTADFKIWNLYLMFNSAIRENVNSVIELEAGHRDFYKYLNFVQTKVDWKLNRYVNLAVGKFFVPFGPGAEVNYYAPFRKLISRPYIYSLREQLPRETVDRRITGQQYWNLFPLTLPANNWRDVGIGFKGEVPVKEEMKVKYDLAIVNGLKQETKPSADCFHCHAHRHGNMDAVPTPEDSCLFCHAPHHRQENWDNNSNKTIAGRIGFSPKEGIELGLSYATGKYDTLEKYGVDLLGIDGQINIGKLSILGEYVSRIVEADKGDLGTGAAGEKGSFTLEGYYIRAAYRIIEGRKHLEYLDAVVRYDTIDPNTDVKDELDRNRITVGLALSPYKHMLFKLEYQMVDEPNVAKIKNDGYMFSLSAAF